jgi:hypothetical protein
MLTLSQAICRELLGAPFVPATGTQLHTNVSQRQALQDQEFTCWSTRASISPGLTAIRWIAVNRRYQQPDSDVQVADLDDSKRGDNFAENRHMASLAAGVSLG